jgi:hypothetical protein
LDGHNKTQLKKSRVFSRFLQVLNPSGSATSICSRLFAEDFTDTRKSAP